MPVTINPGAVQLDFDNTELAFRYKTDSQLWRSVLLFQSFNIPVLVKYGPVAARWALQSGLPVKGLMREWFFKQFCGGHTLDETVPLSELLARYGVKTALDYGVEARKSDEGFDNCRDEVLRMLDHGARHPEQVSHVALKVTGLCNADVLERMQAGGQNSMLQKQYDKLVGRLEAICQRAQATGIPVLIDAEESWMQEPIDRLAESLMARYNQSRAVVHTTVQLYRNDRPAYTAGLYERAKAGGWIAGVKLVRGAYIEKETLRAREKGYPNPLFPNKAAVDAAFDDTARFCLERMEQFSIFAGTHNEASCRKIADWMVQNGLDTHHPHVYFSQLYGMSDNLSFNLAGAGFNVAKYLPYGPLEEVLPYLFRRAQENSSIQGQSSRELTLLQREYKRRKCNRRNA